MVIQTAILLFALAALTVVGHCETEPLELSVMSFNVRWDGLDKGRNAWENRRPVTIETLRLTRPDIVGLQEPSSAQTRDLDEALEDYASFQGEHPRDETITFLYRTDRFLLEEGGSFWLVAESDLSGGTRRCVWVHLREKSSGRAFYAFNNHFDHRSSESRQQSARALIEGIAKRRHSDPFVVVGDFNEVEHGPAMRWLRGGLVQPDTGEVDKPVIPLVDTFRLRHPTQLTLASGHGFTGRREGVRIDYVFVREQDEVLEAKIIYHNREGLYPSDHYPVWARVRLHP